MANEHEWLKLVDISGPFLAEPALRDCFPPVLGDVDTSVRRRLRSTYEEWQNATNSGASDAELVHEAWIETVLADLLGYEDSDLRSGEDLPEQAKVSLMEHGVTIEPGQALTSRSTDGPACLLMIDVLDHEADTEDRVQLEGWMTTPVEKMIILLRGSGCPLGLITNGEKWVLVHALEGEVASHATWHARYWLQERDTLRAFAGLLHVGRFYGPPEGKLPALFEKSKEHQGDVTETLGDQVARAIEVLVSSLDRANQQRHGKLLEDVQPPELYEAGLTVMMRLVFLLAAEERGLILLGDPKYDAHYALSSLRMQLKERTDAQLDNEHEAWSRLLALFRMVYGGVRHPALHLPALGGSLFDPDRFPFLEGRVKGTSWKTDPATPLPINDRTVSFLLDAIQLFQGRALSYAGLDVEQIGHVYEGLLEKTVRRIDETTLQLKRNQSAKNPFVTLREIREAEEKGGSAVAELIAVRSGKQANTIQNQIDADNDDGLVTKLLTTCRGDAGLTEAVTPYVDCLGVDSWGYPLVHPEGAFVVGLGQDRRESGSHYTPRSLTEKIVEETLTPVVYVGPSEGKPKEEWTLKSAEELLDLKVCDPAMGSGAFLVQVCRWLSDRLVEAWAKGEEEGEAFDAEGRMVKAEAGAEPLPKSADDRSIIAKRIIAEKCLYGVDMNPLAVELAKLSLWLTTLSKGHPFGFLDHNLKCGNSLLGIDDVTQVIELSMTPGKSKQERLFGRTIRESVEASTTKRLELREIPIRDIRDVEAMAEIDGESRDLIGLSTLLADALVGVELAETTAKARKERAQALAGLADDAARGNESVIQNIRNRALEDLATDAPSGAPRKPFHWALEFPEVFGRENGGLDAIVGNPPFLGNRLWKGTFGERFQWQCQLVLGASPGKIDLCVVFHRRAADLIRKGGSYGLLATSNIAEGSAIAVGLGEIIKRGSIYFAKKGMPWPGTAAVVVAVVGFFKGEWNGRKDADGHDCDRIGARLEPEEANGWEPVALSDAMFSFEGVNNSKGLAFVVTPEHTWFKRLKEEPGSLLRPYVTGDDITSSALHGVRRWALEIADRDLDTIERDCPIAYQFINEVVRPTRTSEALRSYNGLIKRWWQFWNHRADLMRQLRQREEFIAYSKVTKHPICMLANSNWIYTNQVVLIGIDREDLFPICLSSLFRSWLEAFSGGGLGVTLRLSISESISKFPLPTRVVAREGIDVALRLNAAAVAWSADHKCGLTDVMNAVHSRDCSDARIAEIRSLFENLDWHVAATYDWSDLDLSYDFRRLSSAGEKYQERFAVAEEVRAEALRRLIALNRNKHEEDVARGHYEKKSANKKSSTRMSRSSSKQDRLDLGD